MTRGIDHGNSQLDESEVDRIYRSNLSMRKLAKLFCISHSTIFAIKHKVAWKWLTDQIDKEEK